MHQRWPFKDNGDSGGRRSGTSSCGGDDEGQSPLHSEDFTLPGPRFSPVSCGSREKSSSPADSGQLDYGDPVEREIPLRNDPMFPVYSRNRSEKLNMFKSCSRSSEGSGTPPSQQERRQSSDEEFSVRYFLVQNESLMPETLEAENERLLELNEDFSEQGIVGTRVHERTAPAEGEQNPAQRSGLEDVPSQQPSAVRPCSGGSQQSETLPSQSELQPHELPREEPQPTTSSGRARKRSNSQRRPFLCHVCGASFVMSQHFRDHMRTHTGERPFPCEVCGYRFSQKSNLTVHKRTHTGERPYRCDVCGKTFLKKSRLNNHKRRHTT